MGRTREEEASIELRVGWGPWFVAEGLQACWRLHTALAPVGYVCSHWLVHWLCLSL